MSDPKDELDALLTPALQQCEAATELEQEIHRLVKFEGYTLLEARRSVWGRAARRIPDWFPQADDDITEL